MLASRPMCSHEWNEKPQSTEYKCSVVGVHKSYNPDAGLCGNDCVLFLVFFFFQSVLISNISPQEFFILSGESEFTEQGVDHDFRQFYETRINILEKEEKKKSKRLRDLMDYFNTALFPDEHVENQNVVDEEEARLLKAISDDEDENEVDEEGLYAA
jgi:hypothetical protein